MRAIKREPEIFALMVLLFGALFLFVLLPLFHVFKACFYTVQEGQSAFSLQPVLQLVNKSYNRQPFYNSMLLGALVSVIGTFIAFVFAYAIVRTDMPLKKFIRGAATLPIISPPFVIALSAILLFGRNGFITRKILLDALHMDIYARGFNIFGLNGLTMVEVLSYFPTGFLLLIGVLQSIEPSVEEAATNLGASRWKVFRNVTLPLAMPGILSSMLLIFTESLADFGTPLILSGRFNVLSVQAYLQITGNDNQSGGAALALVLLIPSIAAYFFQNVLLEKKSFVTVSGKATTSSLVLKGKTLSAALFCACMFFVSFIFLFYGLVLFGSFTKLWGLDYSLTLENYKDAFTLGWDSIKDSLILAAVATPVTGILGMVIAYIVERKKPQGSKWLEVISMLTFAVPGTVVGIGYILTFNQKPLLLQGTASIIVLLFIFRNMPVGIRSGIASLKLISPQIEEASTNLGASSFTTFTKITLPLIAPAFFSGLVYSFVRSMTAISAVIFVVSGSWNLITVAILGFVENSDLSQAAALSMLLVFFVMCAMFGIQFILDRMFKRVNIAVSTGKG